MNDFKWQTLGTLDTARLCEKQGGVPKLLFVLDRRIRYCCEKSTWRWPEVCISCKYQTIVGWGIPADIGTLGSAESRMLGRKWKRKRKRKKRNDGVEKWKTRWQARTAKYFNFKRYLTTHLPSYYITRYCMVEGFTPRSAKPYARPARYLKPLFIVEFIELYRFFFFLSNIKVFRRENRRF